MSASYVNGGMVIVYFGVILSRMVTSDIPEAIRQLRKHYGESQQAFATRLGISISSLANYEIGLRLPDFTITRKLYGAACAVDRIDLADQIAARLGYFVGRQDDPRYAIEVRQMRIVEFILTDPRAASIKKKFMDLMGEAGALLKNLPDPAAEARAVIAEAQKEARIKEGKKVKERKKK